MKRRISPGSRGQAAGRRCSLRPAACPRDPGIRSYKQKTAASFLLGISIVRWLLVILLISTPSYANSVDKYPFDDPKQEQRFKELSEAFRCLVCQNQTLADSDAPLAQDLRRQIYEQVKLGDSDEAITLYLTQRYGDFVLFKPPVRASTSILWFLPAFLMIIGGVIIIRLIRRSKTC